MSQIASVSPQEEEPDDYGIEEDYQVEDCFEEEEDLDLVEEKALEIADNFPTSQDLGTPETQAAEIDDFKNNPDEKKHNKDIFQEIETSEIQTTQADDSKNNTDEKKSKGSLSAINKDIFLSCLWDCGRDFERLTHFYNKRYSKSNSSTSRKTKSQIQNYYYNTWYKISSYVKDITDLDRPVLEVLTIINYYALYKASLEDSIGIYLRPLVLDGSISYKSKGRVMTVKTPNCKALKNMLCDLVTGKRNIPQELEITVTPLNSRTWNFFQCLSLNPRFIFHVNKNSKLSQIFDHFNEILNEIEPNFSISFLRICPNPNVTLVNVPKEIELPAKYEFNYELYKMVTDHNRSQMLSNQGSVDLLPNSRADQQSSQDVDPPPDVSQKIKNACWSSEDAENLTFSRIYSMMKNPKKIELFYDMDTSKNDDLNSVEDTVTTENMAEDEFSSDIQYSLLNRLVELSKGHFASESRPRKLTARSLVDISTAKKIIFPSRTSMTNNEQFLKQLKPLKNQFIKKMLFDKKTIEVDTTRFNSSPSPTNNTSALNSTANISSTSTLNASQNAINLGSESFYQSPEQRHLDLELQHPNALINNLTPLANNPTRMLNESSDSLLNGILSPNLLSSPLKSHLDRSNNLTGQDQLGNLYNVNQNNSVSEFMPINGDVLASNDGFESKDLREIVESFKNDQLKFNHDWIEGENGLLNISLLADNNSLDLTDKFNF